MGIPSATQLSFIMSDIENRAAGAKSAAQSALTTLQNNTIDTAFAFSLIDQLNGLIGYLQQKVTVTGLTSYAAANIPNYTGNLVNDMNATIAAAQTCVNWVVNAFPKDSTNTWLLAYSFDGVGNRNARKFTPTETAVLQSRMQDFINTIS